MDERSMKNHEPLIAMRRRGRKPSAVFLVVDCAGREEDLRWPEIDPGMAHVAIEPHDVPSRLDLRCVIGCNVHVLGFDEERLRAVFDAAVGAGAALVASVFDGQTQVHRRETARG